MKIKKRAPRIRFTASSGNVVTVKLLGSRRQGEDLIEVQDASWRYPCSQADIDEANAHFASVRPDVTGLFYCHVNDPDARSAVASQFLYGGSRN